MKKIGIIVLTFGLTSLLISCGKSSKMSRTFVLDGENKEINSSTLREDTLTHNFYSSIDVNNPYGYGWSGSVGNEFEGKKIKIVTSCKQKVSESFDGGIVIQLKAGDKEIIWRQFAVKDYLTEKNVWTTVKDSVIIEAKDMKGGPFSFGTYPWKQSGSGTLETDDLTVKIEEAE